MANWQLGSKLTTKLLFQSNFALAVGLYKENIIKKY